MARIVFGTYMIRYPLGGMMANVAGYLAGLTALGHDVVVVERAVTRHECFDPKRGAMTDDPSAGIAASTVVLERMGLVDQWCFVDVEGRCFGLTRSQLLETFRTADLYIDYGAHGSFAQESEAVGCRVLIDGEPGMNQIKMERAIAGGHVTGAYDAFYTVGRNVGTPRSAAPSGGQRWGHLFHPVDTRLIYDPHPPAPKAPFTTVMNWQSHAPIEWRGTVYGQKDVEFARFQNLPRMTSAPLEIAVSGRNVPTDQLTASGWRVVDAHHVSRSYDSFVDYVRSSAGEFGVCKETFVALRTGWFSDRSGIYLSMGRPVVVQDTGCSAHLPSGAGLFMVDDPDAAASALDSLMADPGSHQRAAREIACEYLDSRKVVGALLAELGF